MFYRVRSKVNAKDSIDFKSEEDARTYILDKELHEDTHELCKFYKNDISLEFFEHGKKPFGVLIKSDKDPGHVNVIIGMTNL